MKVLLFTHKSDIDGMGPVVLSLLAYKNVDYILCETFNLEKEIDKYFESNKIYEYDKILITDLCPNKEYLSKLANDQILNNKILIFDHHKTALEYNEKNYPFVTLKISDDKGLCSGTSLFYDYLIENDLIPETSNSIASFTELTRRYDTWEWKTKYNDETAHKLSILFDAVGCNGYIELMYQKLMDDTLSNFSFTNFEIMLINNKLSQIEEKITNYANKLIIKELFGLKAGIVFIDYEYRNDLSEYLKNNNYDIDFAMLIALDTLSISYRSIKDDVNVRIIAEKLGGKGHDKASSSPITNENITNILNILIKE